MSETKAPQGIIAIITDPSGHVSATAADFRVGPAAGFSQRGIQENRATSEAWRGVIRARCDSQIADAFIATSLDLRSVRHQLQVSGWTQTVVPIGYEAKAEGKDV